MRYAHIAKSTWQEKTPKANQGPRGNRTDQVTAEHQHSSSRVIVNRVAVSIWSLNRSFSMQKAACVPSPKRKWNCPDVFLFTTRWEVAILTNTRSWQMDNPVKCVGLALVECGLSNLCTWTNEILSRLTRNRRRFIY